MRSFAYGAMYNLLLPYNRKCPLTIDNIMITMDNMMILSTDLLVMKTTIVSPKMEWSRFLLKLLGPYGSTMGTIHDAMMRSLFLSLFYSKRLTKEQSFC